MNSATETVPECCVCGTTNNIIEAPDPFRQEVYDDDPCVLMCDACRHDRAMGE